MSLIRALVELPGETDKRLREFQCNPTMDQTLSGWLDAHRPDWRDPGMAIQELAQAVMEAQNAAWDRP